MKTLAAVLTLVLLGGCASQQAGPRAAAEPRRQCFWASQVNSFAAADDRTIHVRVGVKDVYRLELLGACPQIDWTQTIGIESRGGSTICSGLDATLIAPSSIGPQRCAVRNLRRLTEAETAALEPRARP